MKSMYQIDIDLINTPPFPRASILELLSSKLMEMGSTSTEEILKRKRSIGIRGFLSAKRHKTQINRELNMECSRIHAFFPNMGSPKITINTFNDYSWKESWKKYAKPIRIASNLIVNPHEKLPKDFPKDGIILHIDPEMAFGTGSHPTTYLCLKELTHLATNGPRSFLDVGCGSGILSIAARKLAIPKVLGIEIDPVAANVARKNLKKHGIQKSVRIKTGSIDQTDCKFDIIIANILLNTIVELLPDLKKRMKPKGTLILSGILTSQEKEIRKHLRRIKLRIKKIKKYRGWIILSCQVRPAHRLYSVKSH